MTPRPTVIGNPVSPYVRKVLAACAVKGVEVEIDPITPFLGDDAFESLSPLRRVPVWIEGDVVLNDSSVICEYIEETRPGPSLWPADPVQRARARWLEEFGDTRLGELLIWKLFFRLALQPRLFGVDADPAETELTRSQLPETFDYLESVTPETGYLFGPTAGMADFSVAAPFMNAAVVGVTVDAARWPRLAAWLERMEASPLGPLNEAARGLVRTPIKAQRDRLAEFGFIAAARDHRGEAPRRGPMTPT
jgi:glutathione S-transferase